MIVETAVVLAQLMSILRIGPVRYKLADLTVIESPASSIRRSTGPIAEIEYTLFKQVSCP